MNLIDSTASFPKQISSITSMGKLGTFLLSLKKERQSLTRPVCVHIHALKNNLEEIQKEHRLLSKLNNSTQVAHMVFTLGSLFNEREDLGYEYEKKWVIGFCQHLHSEAWLTYGKWLVDDINSILKFQKETSEEYQLRGLLDDFRHEIESAFLSTIQKKIRQKIIQIDTEPERRFQFEKELIFERKQIIQVLLANLDLLKKIEEGISALRNSQIKYDSLRKKVVLIRILWEDDFNSRSSMGILERLMLQQLLDQEMQVAVYIAGEPRSEAYAFAFSIRHAFAIVSQNFEFDSLFQLAFKDLPDTSPVLPLFRKKFLEIFRSFDLRPPEKMQRNPSQSLVFAMPRVLHGKMLVNPSKDGNNFLNLTDVGWEALDLFRN